MDRLKLQLLLQSQPFENQTIRNQIFCPNFRWFLIERQPFVQILNGWTFRFQIPYKIWTIYNPTSFGPLKIQILPDFRSPTLIKQYFVICMPFWFQAGLSYTKLMTTSWENDDWATTRLDWSSQLENSGSEVEPVALILSLENFIVEHLHYEIYGKWQKY